jgi:hypothetical protein
LSAAEKETSDADISPRVKAAALMLMSASKPARNCKFAGLARARGRRARLRRFRRGVHERRQVEPVGFEIDEKARPLPRDEERVQAEGLFAGLHFAASYLIAAIGVQGDLSACLQVGQARRGSGIRFERQG